MLSEPGHLLLHMLKLYFIAHVVLDMGLKGQMDAGEYFRVGEQQCENSNSLHIQFHLFWEAVAVQ